MRGKFSHKSHVISFCEPNGDEKKLLQEMGVTATELLTAEALDLSGKGLGDRSIHDKVNLLGGASSTAAT